MCLSASTTATLPRSLENGYNRGRLDSLTSPPVFIEGRPEGTPGGGIRTSIAAMATMPRHHMHHISNGNGYPVGGNGYPGGHPGGQQWTSSPPPPPPPPHHHGSISGSGSISGLAGSSATLPIKKKSVTIG